MLNTKKKLARKFEEIHYSDGEIWVRPFSTKGLKKLQSKLQISEEEVREKHKERRKENFRIPKNLTSKERASIITEIIQKRIGGSITEDLLGW